MPPYTYDGPIDCEVDIDVSGLKGKTAIVTGGALRAVFGSAPECIRDSLTHLSLCYRC